MNHFALKYKYFTREFIITILTRIFLKFLKKMVRSFFFSWAPVAEVHLLTSSIISWKNLMEEEGVRTIVIFHYNSYKDQVLDLFNCQINVKLC